VKASMDSRSTSTQMLVTYLVILAVYLQRVQSTCGDYTQEQCADSSTMHQFKRCVHKVFHACLKRHPLKRDPHEENVERDPNGMNAERDPHGKNVERDPHGLNMERDPHGMNVERDPHGMSVKHDPHGINVERDSHGINVERDSHGMNVERDSHGMNVERDPHGENVERDPHGMNMERDPNRTPVLCHTIVYVWKKERFCHVKCFWLKYKVPHIYCEKK